MHEVNIVLQSGPAICKWFLSNKVLPIVVVVMKWSLCVGFLPSQRT